MLIWCDMGAIWKSSESWQGLCRRLITEWYCFGRISTDWYSFSIYHRVVLQIFDCAAALQLTSRGTVVANTGTITVRRPHRLTTTAWRLTDTAPPAQAESHSLRFMPSITVRLGSGCLRRQGVLIQCARNHLQEAPGCRAGHSDEGRSCLRWQNPDR